jgi:hypothetical protein
MNVASVLFAALLCLFSIAYAVDPEFGGQCVMGLSQGRQMATDCSVLWVGPDDRLYCFHNDAAREKFLQAPKENLARARAFWEDPENLNRLIPRE